MIPVLEAYNRVIRFLAQPGDVDLLIAAAQQGGMSTLIMDIGVVLKTDKDAFEAYQINPSIPNMEAWVAADTATREALKNHMD